MADDSSASPQPNINIINIASDDTMWVLEANHEELLQVLADPAGWVSANVKLGETPATLWQPFVVVFHEVPATPGKPTIHVQGIHETAILTVKYSRSSGPTPSHTGLLPEGEILSVIESGGRFHTHLELRGFSRSQVANTLFTAVTTPAAYIAALNELPQAIQGVPTPTSEKKVFVLSETAPPHVTYQGYKPKSAPAATVASAAVAKPEDDTNCTVNSGDANQFGQVIVDGVIVKTYSPWPQ